LARYFVTRDFAEIALAIVPSLYLGH